MNEQIKQTMLDATKDMPETYYWPGEYVEKFAELIIQECGQALSPMLRDMISRGHAFDLIKKHFGVETSEVYTQEQLDEAEARGKELAGKLRVE